MVRELKQIIAGLSINSNTGICNSENSTDPQTEISFGLHNTRGRIVGDCKTTGR